MKETLLEISKMIDHAVLHPMQNDTDLAYGCALGKKYNVASVCVKPYQVKKAVASLSGTGVMVGTVIGFPHGANTTEVKLFECRKAIEEGAAELDMVVNIGKLIQQDFDYILNEITQANKLCINSKVLLKVIFETDYIDEKASIIELCGICNKAEVAFIKTSTGFGFNKNEKGAYSYVGANEENVRLMIKHSNRDVKVKASGGIKTLEQVLKYKHMGVERIGTSATADIMEEAIRIIEKN